MKIELLGWTSEGLRCPDVAIDLTLHGKVAPVSLVQMPNGTGKTTTLAMLMAALDGRAEEWSPEQVRSYRRPGDENLIGQFIVRLLHDGRPLTFELTLNYDEGTARYRTTIPGSGGMTTGHHPPTALHRFLTPQFTNLFVFDGEFADRLLDPDYAEAERAIDALCQLYLLQDIAEFADQEWERATKKRTATTATGLASYQKSRALIAKRLLELTDAQAKAKRQESELNDRVSKLKEFIGTHMSRVKGVNERYEKAKSELAGAENRVTAESGSLMQSIRLPHLLHPQIPHALTYLKENLDRLQLPENTSAQFFEELMEEDHCICGREMTEEARGAIQSHARRYLGSDEAGVINALKKDIDQFMAASEGESGQERLTHSMQALSAAVRERQEAEGTVRALKQQLIEQGDQQLQQWQEELEEKERTLAGVAALLRGLSGAGDESEPIEKALSLSLLNRKLAEADNKISEITKTVELHDQTKLIKKIAEGARQVARERIRGQVLADCNQALRKVLSQDPIQLERIDSSLHISRQAGASVGQTLAVGYTFLMTVLNRGQNDFPLIVDSPANPLDAGRRRQIGQLIPGLCSQFVGFTISTERLGFVSALEATRAQIKYMTLFRKTGGTAELMAKLPKKGVQQTANGVVVEDRDYFLAFDVEKEVE
ncbi:MAG: hypothetical protein WDO17_15505 [Alphaproteobacteria bacterium]